MKKTALYLTLAAFILTACGTQDSPMVENIRKDGLRIKVLHMDRIPDEAVNLNLSDLFSGFEIIPLETTDASLASYIVWVYFTDNNVFTSYQNVGGGNPGPATLLRFDREGYFKNRIGTGGRGPGEHMGYSLRNLITDDDSEEVFVDWQPDSMDEELMKYRYDGTFMSKTPVPMQFLSNKTRYGVNSWFATGRAAGKPNFGSSAFQSDSVMIVFFDDNGNIQKIIPRTTFPPSGTDKYSPPGGVNLYKSQDEYYVYFDGVDTIFKIADTRLSPVWVLNRGKDAMPYNTIIDRESLGGKHNTRFMAETGNNLILFKYIGTDIRIVIVDKQTNKAAYVNIIDDVFGLIKPEEFKYYLMSIKDNRIARSWEAVNYINSLKENNIDPESLIKYSTNPERLRSISPESNPVIITFNIISHIKLK